MSQEGYRADPENIKPVVSLNPIEYGGGGGGGALWPPISFPYTASKRFVAGR